MNEEQTQSTQQTPSDQATGQSNSQSTGQQSQQSAGSAQSEPNADQLLNEIDRLGNQLMDAIRTAWNSDQRKQLEVEVGRGFNTVVTSLSEGIQKLGESPQTQNILNKAEEVMSSVGDQVRNSKVTHDLAGSLRKGLQGLNEQLGKFTSEMKKNEPPTGEQAQDIKIDKE